MPQQQREIDFENPSGQQSRTSKRGTDRGNVEQLIIPPPPDTWRRRRVSVASCKAVLMSLDNHQQSAEGWYIKARTLAAELGLTRDTVQRALTWLEELGYVQSTRTGRTSLLSLNRQAIAAAIESGSIGRMRNIHRKDAQHPSEGCATSIGRMRNIHQKDAQHPQEGCAASIDTSNPSQNNPTTPTTASWEMAAELLRSQGIAAVESCLTKARAAGGTPDQVRALVELFRVRPGANGQGALQYRVGLLCPGDVLTKRWPSPLGRTPPPASKAADFEGEPDPLPPEVAETLEKAGSWAAVLQLQSRKNQAPPPRKRMPK